MKPCIAFVSSAVLTFCLCCGLTSCKPDSAIKSGAIIDAGPKTTESNATQDQNEVPAHIKRDVPVKQVQ